MRGKGGCVVGDAHHDQPSIGEQIIDTVRDGDARGIRAEIVIVDQAGRQVPSRAGIFEMADQFALFGIDANDGETAPLKSVSEITEVEELIVAIGAVVGREFLVIDAQGIAHLME
jgi:Ni2+-binding GTPase involved in maturation of urease and hydrogenase